MKAILFVGAAMIAAPVLGSSPIPKGLPGVDDKEATIPSSDIRQTVRGHGDVFFVRDRSNQWYRVQLNDGCAHGSSNATLVFRRHGPGSGIDRFTTVVVGGEMKSCAIRSIRRSKAPPQIDPKSPVTLQ